MTKQTYGLALWWGWAKWYAHIWAIQYIEKHDIVIDEISGASMWAIIGAMYASGISPQLMKHIFSELSYAKLFDGSIDVGVFGGKKLTKRLESVFGDAQIQDCKIPLKIVACDIETGDKIVFETWSIVQALRASVAFPGLISPAEIDDKLLVDGGIVDNLPIDLLENNRIIAVSVVDTLYEKIETNQSFRWFTIPDSPFTKTQRVINNSINVMLQRIEDLTIQSYDKELILIRPDMSKYTMFDMKKLEEIVTFGYEQTALVLGE